MSEPPFVHYDDVGRLPGGDFRFLHVEPISIRVRKYNWELFPHRHRDLFQLFLIDTGAGRVNFDLWEDGFQAPALVFVPALVIHSLRYETGTRGRILTLSDAYLDELVRFSGESEVLAGLQQQAYVQPLGVDKQAYARIAAALGTIAENLGAAEPRRGRGAMCSAFLLEILSWLARLGHERVRPPGPEQLRRSQLYKRFRDCLEQHFREQLPISSYVEKLGVTERTLLRACREVAGESPLKIVHRRVLLEAQRLLLYSAMSVTQIAYHLNFKEPSHFNRFFVEQTEETPLAFRRNRMG